jgi:GNAT superfamily N-acetyltransferase
MPSIEVRPFHRRDRDQLTALANRHIQAVVPGAGVSVSTMLNHLERQPDEFIVDPWVRERLTLVAEQRGRVAAAAHLLRYHDDARAGESYRGCGEIRWFLYWPGAPAGNPYWPDASDAADRLMATCLRRLDGWGAHTWYAAGDLPAPGVYGVPEQWPHIRARYRRAGFTHTGGAETVHLAPVDDLPHPAEPPVPGLAARRSVGVNGTRLSAVLDAEPIGYIEVEAVDQGERSSRHHGWADIGNLHVATEYRRRGVATWLVGQAADWLRLAQIERLLGYASLDDCGDRAFLSAAGFRELTRTLRGWTRTPRP